MKRSMRSRRHRARRAAQHVLQHAETRNLIERMNAAGDVASLLFMNASIKETVAFLISGPPR